MKGGIRRNDLDYVEESRYATLGLHAGKTVTDPFSAFQIPAIDKNSMPYVCVVGEGGCVAVGGLDSGLQERSD
jgi:hypothetical protein